MSVFKIVSMSSTANSTLKKINCCYIYLYLILFYTTHFIWNYGGTIEMTHTSSIVTWRSQQSSELNESDAHDSQIHTRDLQKTKSTILTLLFSKENSSLKLAYLTQNTVGLHQTGMLQTPTIGKISKKYKVKQILTEITNQRLKLK